MKGIPGTLQEGGAPFHTTHWSVVLLAAQSQSLEDAQRALTDFCQAYWPPLYAFLRRRGHSPGDAQDLTQGFFVHLLAHDTLSRASREKGRLRTFLLGSLQHYLANEYDHANRLKRGGGVQIVSMDEHLAEAEALMIGSSHGDEGGVYDQSWAVTLMSQAWEHLEATFVAEGKQSLFEELKPFVVGGTTDSAQPGGGCRASLRAGFHVAHLAPTSAAALPRRVTHGGRAHRVQSSGDRRGDALSPSLAVIVKSPQP